MANDWVIGEGVYRTSDNDGTYGESSASAGDGPIYASDGTGASSKYVNAVWTKKMLRNFYETTAFMEIANTDYEG